MYQKPMQISSLVLNHLWQDALCQVKSAPGLGLCSLCDSDSRSLCPCSLATQLIWLLGIGAGIETCTFILSLLFVQCSHCPRGTKC